MIRVEDLRFRYPGAAASALDGVSFNVAQGEVYGLLGPSGAGKSTTQRILMGLLRGYTGEVELFGRDRVELGGEQDVARSPFAFCAIQGDIGLAQQFGTGAIGLGANGDADAGGYEHLVAGERERPAERMQNALGDAERGGLGVGGLDEHGELIPAEAGDHLAFGGSDEALAEDGKELVADAVAERVVQVLESVDIEEEHGDTVVALRPGEGTRKT